MADTEKRVTRYRVLYRREDGLLVEFGGEYDGPPPSAFKEALRDNAVTVEYVSLVAVPVTNWTELRPKVETVTQIRFENLEPVHVPRTQANPVGSGEAA